MTTATVESSQKDKTTENDELLTKLQNIADGTDDRSDEERRLFNEYVYSSGTFQFILHKGFKPETLESIETTPVPFLPKWHKGIISIHGLIMPVIDILGFTQQENLDVKKIENKKTYYLKLDHKEFKSVVFTLDSIPRIINTQDYESSKGGAETPNWIEEYLTQGDSKIALIDHKKLFDQISNKQ